MDGMGGAHASHRRRRSTERTCTSYRSTRSESASFSCHSSTVCPMISSPSRFGSPRNGLDLQSRLFCLRRVGLMRPSSGLGTGPLRAVRTHCGRCGDRCTCRVPLFACGYFPCNAACKAIPDLELDQVRRSALRSDAWRQHA